MGICASDNSEEAIKGKQIEKQLVRDYERDNKRYKLLLLGAGESGKSTLFKQMILIHGVGFPEEERKGFTKVVHQNVLQSMKTLCEQADIMKQQEYDQLSDEDKALVDSGDKKLPTQVDEALIPSKKWVEDIKMDDEHAHITPEVAQHIWALWNDSGIKSTYEKRSAFQLFDSAQYFFDKVLDIGNMDYVPNAQDVLRSRVRTTGIVEQEFEIEGNTFRMFDVGGQRNERKKWIHCFEDVTAVLFVAALSEYDQVLFEDEEVNRMDEALALFKEIACSRWFRNSSMILFLNKKDLFREKLQKVPLENHIPRFATYCENNIPVQIEDLYNDACNFMEELFVERSKVNVYPHVTCATDTDNVRVIFNSVKDTIIRKSLQEGGLLA